jgi:hypothetical protein
LTTCTTTRPRRRSRRPRQQVPACRNITIVPLHNGQLAILGPGEQRAIFKSPIHANIYVQCLMGSLEHDAQILRAHWEQEHVDHQEHSQRSCQGFRQERKHGDSIDGAPGPEVAAADHNPD